MYGRLPGAALARRAFSRRPGAAVAKIRTLLYQSYDRTLAVATS
jgi:hypothetical protein